MTTPMGFKEDGSLQNFGRHALPTIGPALDEVAGKAKTLGAQDQAAADALKKMATHAETTLPAANLLRANIQAVAAEANSIAAAEADLVARRSKNAAAAAELPQNYRRNHEMDEARVNNPRGSRDREKRADVSSAEKDT
jgi:hypothetical protein